MGRARAGRLVTEGRTRLFDRRDFAGRIAAQLLWVSEGTIRSRIKSGDLPAERLRGGQTVLIDWRDVLALLEEIVPKADV